MENGLISIFIMWYMKPLLLKPVMAIFNNSHVRTLSGEEKQYWVSPSFDFWVEIAPHIYI